MAVIVDPLRLDLHYRRQEWRRPARTCHGVHSFFSLGHRPLTPYISFATVFPRENSTVDTTITNNPKRAEPKAVAAAVDKLAARFGNRLVTSQAVRDQHAHTTTWLPSQPPD